MAIVARADGFGRGCEGREEEGAVEDFEEEDEDGDADCCLGWLVNAPFNCSCRLGTYVDSEVE